MSHKDYLTTKHFKAVVVNDDTYSEKDVKNSTRLLKKGIFASPAVAKQFQHEEIQDLINEFGIDLKNVNSTFYKSFKEMNEKSDFELRFEQLLHYMSTYGDVVELQNHGEIFEPNSLDLAEIAAAQKLLKSFVTIEAVTKEELTERIHSVIYSGIALKSTTVDDLESIVDLHRIDVDINEIKNKELKVKLSYKLKNVINDIDFTMRTLVYGLTGKTQIVKTKQLYAAMSDVNNPYIDDPFMVKDYLRPQLTDYLLTYFDKFGIDDAIKTANRYRKLWLVIRKSIRRNSFVNRSVKQVETDERLVSIINKLLRLSKKGHEKTKLSTINLITSGQLSIIEIQQAIENMSIYQLARIYNATAEKIDFLKKQESVRLFKIRNGKTFLKKESKKKNQLQLEDNLQSTLFLIKNQIKKTLDLSDKIIVDNGLVNYAVPTSEKNFVGMLPDFSVVEFEKNARIGIAWYDDGDIDLHAQSASGQYLGWNTTYRNGEMTYSGDMTHLNKHGFAAEYFDISANLDDVYNLNINCYFASDRLKTFDVIVGDSITENTMHDLNSIKFKIKQDFTNTSNMSVGLMTSINDKLCYIVSNTNFKANIVPDTQTISLALAAIKRKASTRLMMQDIYRITDAKVVSSIDEVDEKDLDKVVNLNIENLTTESFTSLFN